MNQYRSLMARAAECDDAASACFDPSIRTKLQELADKFRELAERAQSLETSKPSRRSSDHAMPGL